MAEVVADSRAADVEPQPGAVALELRQVRRRRVAEVVGGRLDGINAERFQGLPEEVIAVVGERRWRHWGAVNCLAFSADGKLIYSGGDDGVIRVWDAATGDETAVMKGHDAYV